MNNHFLFIKNCYWESALDTNKPIKIDGVVKVFVTRKGYPDKRYREYRNLLSKKPKYYSGLRGYVDTV